MQFTSLVRLCGTTGLADERDLSLRLYEKFCWAGPSHLPTLRAQAVPEPGPRTACLCPGFSPSSAMQRSWCPPECVPHKADPLREDAYEQLGPHPGQLQHHLPQAVALHLGPAAVLPVGMGHERKHSLSVLVVGVWLRVLAAMPPEADWLVGPLGGVLVRGSCTGAGGHSDGIVTAAHDCSTVLFTLYTKILFKRVSQQCQPTAACMVSAHALQPLVAPGLA